MNYYTSLPSTKLEAPASKIRIWNTVEQDQRCSLLRSMRRRPRQSMTLRVVPSDIGSPHWGSEA